MNSITAPIVEEAYEDGRLIGWRISFNGESLLIWRDQAAMRGFRAGNGFTPRFEKTVEYRRGVIRFGAPRKEKK